MQKVRKGKGGFGRVRMDIQLTAAGNIELAIARSCNNPRVLRMVDAMVDGAVRCEPEVILTERSPESLATTLLPRKGGPVGVPESQRVEIVEGWLKVQGRMKEAQYATSRGISMSTLRRWMRELRAAGKL